MSSYKPWLPATAIARAVDEQPIRTIVAGWSAAWFAATAATARSATREPEQPHTDRGWRADGVVLALDPEAQQVLGEMLLGAPPADVALTTADETAVGKVVAACLADLRARLARGLGLAAEIRWESVIAGAAPTCCWAWRADVGPRPLLHVRIDEAWVVRRARERLPTATVVALSPLAEALAPQFVHVSALVGRSRLTTVELAQLVPGDVVVLDLGTDAPAALAVDGAPTVRTCLVAPHDDRLILTLVA